MNETLLDPHDLEQRNITTFITCLKRLIDDSHTASTDLQALNTQKQAVLQRAQTVFRHKCAATWPHPSPLITITTPPELHYNKNISKWQLSVQIKTPISTSTSSSSDSSWYAIVATSPDCQIYTSPTQPTHQFNNNNQQPLNLTSFVQITPEKTHIISNNDGLIHIEILVVQVPLSRSSGNGNTNTACPVHVGSVSLPLKDWIKSLASSTTSTTTRQYRSVKYLVVTTHPKDPSPPLPTPGISSLETLAIGCQAALPNRLVNDLNFSQSNNPKTLGEEIFVLGDGIATASLIKYVPKKERQQQEEEEEEQERETECAVLKLEAVSDGILDLIIYELERLDNTRDYRKMWSWEVSLPEDREKKKNRHRKIDDALLKESECIVKWIEGMLQQRAVAVAAAANADGGGGRIKDVVGLDTLQHDVMNAMTATNKAFEKP